MSKQMASKNAIPRFGGGFPSSNDDSSDSYEEVEVEEDGSSGSDTSEEMNVMPPVEESERESSSSSDEDTNLNYTDLIFKKEDPNKKTPQTVVRGTFDDPDEGRPPPAKKAVKVVPAAKDQSPSKAKSTMAEKKTDDKIGKTISVEKKIDDKKTKSAEAEKRTDAKKAQSAAAEKKTDVKKEKIALPEKKIDGKKELSTSVEERTDNKKGKITLAMAEIKADDEKVKSISAEKKADNKKGKSIVAEKKMDDQKGKTNSAVKVSDDKKQKIASAEKKKDDKKGKSTPTEIEADDDKVNSILKRVLAQKETDDQTSGGKRSPPELVPSSETLSTARAASGGKGLFGSWDQNVEEEVLFANMDPDEPTPKRTGLGMFGSIRRQKSPKILDEENPDGQASTDVLFADKGPDEPTPKRTDLGMFGAIRRQKSPEILDEENPDGQASTDGPIKEKKGMFGSSRRHKPRNSLDEVNPVVPVEAEKSPDGVEDSATPTSPASKVAPSVEAAKEKKGKFKSLRDHKPRNSLDEESFQALVTDNEEPSREKRDMFGGSLGELPLQEAAPDENNSIQALQEAAPDENNSIQEEKPKRFLSPFRRSKAANEEKTSRVLDVPVGDAPLKEGSSAANIPYNEHRKAVTYRQLGMALILAVLVLVGTNIGTSYLGAKLALEHFDEKSVVNNTIAENVTGPCAFEDVYLEFKIRFDSNPGETGAVLRDQGPIGATLWNFGVGAFFSFSQFQRENTFSICLSPALPYEFELTDLGGDGLVGSFIDSVIYGSWQLMYNEEVVARYHGDCNEPDLTHCGDFCSCRYSITADGSAGDCETNCTDGV